MTASNGSEGSPVFLSDHSAPTDRAVRAERRRIERDLHDGAQQHLVAASLLLGLAARRAAPAADRELAALIDSTRTAVAEAIRGIRDLSRGLHPALLAERGLAAAVRSLADSSPLPVTVVAHGSCRYPEAVEAAAYFVVAEALTNAGKHAAASCVTVTVDFGPARVEAVVADDGRGGADEGTGSGLAGLRDRVTALGGTLTVDSRPGAGTVVRVALPGAGPVAA